MKIKRGLIIMLTLLHIVCCVPVFANAASTELDITEINMEQYFTLSEDGTIDYDTLAAEADGIDEHIISAVEAQISHMNQLVLSGKAYITNDFAAVQYTSLARASGENKVVTHWYGLTELYMDSDKADELYNRLLMLGDNMSNYAFESALEGAGVEGAAGVLMAGYFYNYWYQVGVAKEPGRGIIMNIQTDLLYGGQTIWFSSQ